MVKADSTYHQAYKACQKFITMLSIISLGACTSLSKHPQTLSTSIQKAYAVSPQTADRISPIILQHANKHDIPPTLLAAVIRQESHYKANAKSPSGAIGLMQIMPKYWSKKCVGDLYNEIINIDCGSSILAQYHSQAGSWNKALAYYNVGPHGYENNRKSKKIGKKYAKSVKQHEKKLKKQM